MEASGPREEKTTSSILLPSYKISPCTSDDKVSRKFSFKAEHQNMKTYYFAAEDKDGMKRWMNAMSLASIMQNFARSEKYDTTFSSASNDDEDSGFTSYRSRRYTSQKLNSTCDSNFGSEPLKQRSNSYGDRMGEVYLGSDDKYPNVYKSIPPHTSKNIQTEVPRRQPLYANAPPKPRRLTQSDSYGVYKDCYDVREPEIAAIEASQYSYTDHQKTMAYIPLEQNLQYFPGSDPVLMNTRMQYVDNYSQNVCMEAVPDLYRNQPPRPRSADFLERDAECAVVPDVALYPERRQPQRPKSSLEYYDRYVDSEDCNFDYYREAVRIQADNLYANKNLSKSRKHHDHRPQTENIAYDQHVNIHYMGNNSYLSNEQISPCYASASKDRMVDRYDECANISLSSSQNEHFNSIPGHAKPKKTKEESMQRLVEWKQRMLQSPLTKRNQLRSNSSETSSPMTSPLRYHKSDHRQKVMKDLETHEAHIHNSSRSNDYYVAPTSPRSHSSSPQRHKDYRKRNESSDSQQPCEVNTSAPNFSNIENPKFSPPLPEPSITNGVNISAENLYKENVMYCVDSENNEILFSYDDNSPTSGISNSLQTCHYPPQMHSFTTMPNVSNIGSDNPDISKYDEQDSSEDVNLKERHGLPRSNQEFKGSNLHSHHRTTYSSDDEDDDEMREHELKLNSQGNEQRNADPDLVCEEDKLERDRYHSSSPDYVNIGAICGEPLDGYAQGIKSTPTLASDCHRINQAVLKPLEQVSRKVKNLPDLNDSHDSGPELMDKKSPDMNPYCKKNHQESPYHTETGSLNDSIQNRSFNSKCSYDSETEFDIKREDYYRASQIFYASTRMKHKETVSKRQREVRRSSAVCSENPPQAQHSYVNVVLSDSVSSLDKDIGIPLPIIPYKSSPTKIPPDIVENNASQQKVYTIPKHSILEESRMHILKHDEKFNEPHTGFLDHETVNETSEKDFNTNQYDPKPNQCTEIVSIKHEIGKKLSYEEMRGQLLRKREAPPPNIVQDRIKKFENVEPPLQNNKKDKTDENASKVASRSDHLPSKDKLSMRGIGKRNRHKASRSKSYRRALHSDSEAIAFEDSNESSDDLTMKSAPILLSPLSSVLADLRITAESGKEKSPIKDMPSGNNAMKEYFRELNDENLSASHAENQTNYPTKPPTKASKLHMYEECYGEFRGNIEEAEYLPMFGSKYSKEKEPEYVMMGGCKLSPNSPGIKIKKFFDDEEHVYNEPFSPPPSFLHDVYEKQKTKQFQYQMKSSSSEDSLTENIYEKPIHRFPSGSIRNGRNEYSHKTVQETNSVLMSSLSCSNVTAVGRSNELQERNRFMSDRNITSRSSLHHYEQANLSVSVPDLLQLQELKDSDASDADDEASRDFDTIGGLRLPSYQSPILDQFCNSNSRSQSKGAFHSSFESHIMPLPHHSHLAHSSTKESVPHLKTLKNEVKPLPTYEALYNVATFPQPCAQSTLKGDPLEKFHVQKLRVYTKGKKPEAPKIFPVPFDLEESEICKILERKDSTKAYKTEDVIPTPDMPSLESSVAIDSDSLSENVAYASRAEMPPSAVVMPSSVMNPSYRPDVVPTVVQDDERVPNDKYSPSKSPNSAPYYYSDLYSGHGINFAGQIPLFKRNDVPYLDKTSPPRSNPALLNNVKSSPSSFCKGDVGRKVNKINSKVPTPEDKDALNEKSLMKYWKTEGVKSNIKSSIDILEGSKSKYLDAEKNKYEAGHTLEKTRSSSTMSYFKHRSSTPDLNTCQYQSDEPVYENIAFQPKPKLQKRLSHSLEELPIAPELIDEEAFTEADVLVSPVYENIEFFNSELHSIQENLPIKVEHSPQSIEMPHHSRQIITSHNTSVFAQRQFCSAVSKPTEIENRTNTLNPVDPEVDFLDQNILRRVSEQHFFGKNFKHPYLPATDKPSVENKNSLLNYTLPQNFDTNSVNVSEVKDYKIHLLQEPPTVKLHEDPKSGLYDSDSSSGATSSCDEASIDSDNRHQIINNKNKCSDISRSVSSEIHIREPNHLRKLVQQSDGLMCKGKRLSVSAGDLLGKTHEELVLLLIQLRRNQSKILRAKDKLEQQFKSLQEFLQSNTGKLSGHQSKRDLQRQIQLLENQHEVTQPLVTLVDNMIKLGSLYGSSNRRSFSLPLLDTSQEDISAPSKAIPTPDHFGESSILTKLLAEESTFQKRISEIYSLDKGLRNETNSISSLHQDKEMLEYTLSGMQNKILDHQDRPSELQKLKKQQKMIEKELVRVKRLLSTSAKKIEDAASKNDQMEKDILYLRQILKEALKTGASETKTSQHNRADIEAELSRVQNVLDELANHRHEINNTVLKLKGEAPPTISKEAEFKICSSGATEDELLLRIKKNPEVLSCPAGISDEKEVTHLKKVKKGVEVRASPTGVAGSAPLPVRKKQHSMYLETDLDTMFTRDLAVIHEKELDDIPVYVNAEEINNPSEDIYENLCTIDNSNLQYNSQSDVSGPEQCSMQDINDADERMKRFYGIIPKEKPSEIKTVRIVKRQSERRNRERDKKRVTYDDQSSVWVVEEPDLSSDDLLEIDEVVNKVNTPVATRPSSIHLLTSSLNRQSNSQSAHERLFGNTAGKVEKSFSTGSQDRAYTTKRSKRRHYTVSGYQYVLDPQFSHYFKDRPRSRDDVDMERCLRTANTPDIVRSTIKKNDVFDDRIIERELMLPQKIDIPERYVEVEPEQLSASEKLQRSIKAKNICKMLSETTTTYEDVVEERSKSPEALHKKLSEEKRKRAHLLNLNRAIAREVVEKSKAVAANVCSAENQTSA